MVMVPLETAGLLIRIVVTLILSRLRNILSPTVPRSTAVRAMEVNRILDGALVEETNNAFRSSGDNERGPWGHAIVADHLSGSKVRVDMLRKGPNLNLIVLNVIPIDRVCDGTVRLSVIAARSSYLRG